MAHHLSIAKKRCSGMSRSGRCRQMPMQSWGIKGLCSCFLTTSGVVLCDGHATGAQVGFNPDESVPTSVTRQGRTKQRHNKKLDTTNAIELRPYGCKVWLGHENHVLWHFEHQNILRAPVSIKTWRSPCGP